MTHPEIFDRNIDTWQQEQKEPWMGLRYRLELINMQGYLDKDQLNILDAGGGNGVLAVVLAEAGHRVTIVDYSAEMLTAAQVKIAEHQLQNRVNLVQAELLQIPALFPPEAFDLVLCHNVIQYLSNVSEALVALRASLRQAGILSLVTVNKYAEVYKAAFREKDLLRAETQLTAEGTVATLFDHPIRYFTDQELVTTMSQLGFQDVALYGVRCINDWLPNAPKYQPAYMAQLEALEEKLAQTYPYYLMARFYQVLGRKSGDSLPYPGYQGSPGGVNPG